MMKKNHQFKKENKLVKSMGRIILSVFIAAQPFSSAISIAPSDIAYFERVSYSNELLRIQTDREVPYRIFSLSKPPRLVIELSQTVHKKKPTEKKIKDVHIEKIRTAQFQSKPDKITRVVLDMTNLKAYEAYQEGKVIVLEFASEGGAQTAKSSSGAFSREKKNGVNKKLSNSAHSSISPKHKSGFPQTLSGRTSASVSASAKVVPEGASSAIGSAGEKKESRSKDLIASLPKNPVTIDFDEADIRDVIRVLAEMSGVNMIHASDIRGLVTIHLDQVPFDESFRTILSMQGLVTQQMGENILRILTPESLNADRARSVVTYKTYVLNYARASDMIPHLGAVRISPNASVTVDERSNSLVIMDTPEGLAAAERLLSELDQKPQQVLIEAKIVEVNLDDRLDLGIQWEYGNTQSEGSSTRIVGIKSEEAGNSVSDGEVGFVGVRPNALTGTNEQFVTTGKGPSARGTGVALPGPQEAAFTFGFVNNTDILTMTLNALAVERKGKVLSAPKIITINNQEATIQIGNRLPYSTSVVSNGTAVQNVEFVNVGIILTVTPIINADNRIRLRLKPEVSFGSVGPIGPEVNTREAETEVIIRDGETLVVGGLIDENITKQSQKVPILGDIPILGAFFRNSSDNKVRRELMVFVTPRIVQE